MADRAALLRVFEVQKALYEVRYEINNRPAWLHIPADAVRRLMSDTEKGPGIRE
jgi:maltokinase